MIHLSCHSENFGVKPPDDTFSFIKQLGFSHIDVAPRSMLPQQQIMDAPEEKAEWTRQLAEKHGLILSELFLGPVQASGKNISPSEPEAFNHPQMLRNFERICVFAAKAGFESIMGAAGNEIKEIGWDRSFDNAARTLEKMCEIAKQAGIAMHVEPSRLSLLNTPAAALEMVRRVPLLRYTLDFLHYQVNGVKQEESMRLLPYAGHMHARQAATNWGKCPVEFGEIDYDIILKRLRGLNWNGAIAMEYWCDAQLEANGILAIDQNILMRYELKKLIKKYYS